MSKFIKVLSNELIKIEEYKNPRVCFNSTEYDDIENYCVLRETINPFNIFKENQQLRQNCDVLDEIREYVNKAILGYSNWEGTEPLYLKDDEIGEDLLQILDKVKR